MNIMGVIMDLLLHLLIPALRQHEKVSQQDLESKANESLDYSQLNRDLSQTGTMFSAGMAVKGMGDDAQSGSPGTDHGYQPDPEGPMGTNTSKEIEELHRALQEVGLSRTLPGLESHNASGKEQAGADTATDSRRPVDRSVGDILKEMDEIQKRQQAVSAAEDDVKLMSDYKSPRSPRSPADQAARDRESTRQAESLRLDYEEQIFKLKQENFVLAAKRPSTEEQVARLEKSVRSKKNCWRVSRGKIKRLYEEIRSKEKAAKATEEAMFKENQRLNAELTSVRSLLEQKETELRSKGIITSLAAQQQIAAGNQDSVTEATRAVHLETELRECKELEQRHNEEVDRLKRKLKWYAENQELLDKSTRTIKARDEEIQRFKLRLEELQTETGKRLEENKLRSKEKAADVKKIADLERQIKEMEQIIRRRHPNSLPALMMAAATAPEAAPTVENSRGRTVEVLENRIKKLEKELEKKDEEASTLLRAMEQKYNAVKFEERVADLEGQLRLYKRQGDGDMKQYEHPHTHALALERELENTHGLRSEQARWHQVESELRSQVAALQSTVQEREKELHTAMAMVERLQKTPNGPRLPDKKHGKGAAGDENYLTTGLNAFPDPSQTSKKRYQPEAFADQHIADVVRENEDLRNKIELLQLERDQQRVDLRRSLAETEAVARRSREDYENQIEAMRTAHEKELNRLRAEQALFNSTSKVAALQSRCDSQEVMVQHLQRQLAQREAEVEQMAGLKKREAELKDQVETLQEKLREAKRTQAPEMRHYEALEEKIATLTERHKKREQELESLLRSSQRMASQDLIEEAARWKKMVETKNLEICKFREELDSILGTMFSIAVLFWV
nr:hypothetical protein BaRGS_004191 [Batillaria attramentaria]